MARREIQKNLKLSRDYSVIKWLAQQGIEARDSVGDPHVFPRLDERIASYKKAVDDYCATPHNTDVVIGIGDSLMDFFRGHSGIICDQLNFGLAGSCSPHMAVVAEVMAAYLKSKGLRVRAVVIGCFMGNALLGYQKYDCAQRDALEALDTIRKLWPTRIIVYGLPPVSDIYATLCQEQARQFFTAWVRNDVDARYLDILKAFSGFLGLFPRVEFSLEGIHMTSRAQADFDDMIEEALH